MADTKTRAETLIDEINGSVIFCTGVLNLIENDGCQNAAPCVSAIFGVDKLLCTEIKMIILLKILNGVQLNRIKNMQ